MGRVMVKICGVARASSATAIDGLADYIGVVSSKRGRTPRSVPLDYLRVLEGEVKRSKLVAVLHGYPVGEAARVAASLNVDVVQYHAPLGVEELVLLVSAVEPGGARLAPVIEWTGRGWEPMDPCLYYRLAGRALGSPARLEYLLVDVAKSASTRGARIPLPEVGRLSTCIDRLAVAGGLGPGNVCEVASMGPRVIDVSRGVEEGAPGVKSLSLVVKLLEEARRCSPK